MSSKMAGTGDPLMDEWVEGLLKDPRYLSSIYKLELRPDLAVSLATELLATEGGHKIIAEVSSALSRLNRERFIAGREVFTRHGPIILFSLVAASLPECYTIGRSVEVLERTGRLEGEVFSRIYRTAQFILDAMGEGSFEGLDNGLGSLLRVRLIHSLVRCRQRVQGRAMPVSQEDQVFTLTAFSWVTLRTLERCGIILTNEERENWVYRWGVIGTILGIDQRQIPWTVADSQAFFQDFQSAHGRRTIAGCKLCKSLLSFLATMLQGKVIGRAIANQLLRELTSQQTLVTLGLPPRRKTDRILGVAVRVVMADVATRSWITRRFMDGFANESAVGFHFSLPESFRLQWQGISTKKGSYRD